MKTFIGIIIFILFLCACQEEKKLLTGDILGTVMVKDQDGNQLQDQSGVEVKLFRDDVFIQETLTDIDGSFVLENVEYGKYTIPLNYNNYVQSRSTSIETNLHIVYHVGGYIPTRVSYSLYEIPTWELSVDSITDYGDNRLKVYLKVNGDTLPPTPLENPRYYYFRAFASNSSDVSIDNYTARACGYLSANNSGSPLYILYEAVYGIIDLYLDASLHNLTDETIYMRFYPIAGGQNVHASDNPGALGIPSNVVAFDWE